MKNVYILISTGILIFAIIYSSIKFNGQKNYPEYIIRYGANIEAGDIIIIDGKEEKVLKINKDGSYITSKKYIDLY